MACSERNNIVFKRIQRAQSSVLRNINFHLRAEVPNFSNVKLALTSNRGMVLLCGWCCAVHHLCTIRVIRSVIQRSKSHLYHIASGSLIVDMKSGLLDCRTDGSNGVPLPLSQSEDITQWYSNMFLNGVFSVTEYKLFVSYFYLLLARELGLAWLYSLTLDPAQLV